jgi:hypothetical protein
MHASYRVFLASLLTLANSTLTVLLHTSKFRSNCVLTDLVWFSEPRIQWLRLSFCFPSIQTLKHKKTESNTIHCVTQQDVLLAHKYVTPL